jgi:hypothetical protein
MAAVHYLFAFGVAPLFFWLPLSKEARHSDAPKREEDSSGKGSSTVWLDSLGSSLRFVFECESCNEGEGKTSCSGIAPKTLGYRRAQLHL